VVAYYDHSAQEGWQMSTATTVVKYPMILGGHDQPASSGEWLEVTNPFTREVWAEVPVASASDVDDAVAAARHAFKTGPWSSALPSQRAQVLRNIGACLSEHVDELADLQVRENGKAIKEQHPQVAGLAGFCYYFAGIAENIRGETIPLGIPNMVNFTVREPLGVVGAIAPWNSQLTLLLWKLAPALAAGNTIVVKPSEVSPVSTLRLVRLMHEAGLPDGVVNVVTGAGDVGANLVAHPGVDKVAFTGSTAVGRSIAKSASERLARYTLELGGKSPNIVFDDASLDHAVTGAIAAGFSAGGQACVAGSRLLIHEGIYDEFAEALIERAGKIRLGNPADWDTDIGTIANKAQYDKVLRYIQIGLDEGARLRLGGGVPDDPKLGRGLFIQPTIFDHVNNSMRIAKEEIFGPVVCLIPFKDEQDALQIANDTAFGLASGIWTNDLRRAHRMARQLRSGTVWVNTFRRTSYAMPFGGIKDSGVGRENGHTAVEEYTEVKSVWINLADGINDPFNPRA
jgi:(Z)-2-((N-methylformamido)methylene)-5-hydroxybutyrolactone dehydrogenase